MKLTPKSKGLLNDGYEVVDLYFKYLHLGLFFDQLAKHDDLSTKAKDIQYKDNNNIYLLDKNYYNQLLKDINSKPDSPSIFSYLIVNNSIRGITMAIDECLKNKEIKDLIIREAFKNDRVSFRSFSEITDIIRNILSHNISDQYRLDKNYMGKQPIDFKFDYSKWDDISLPKENYIINFKIVFGGKHRNLTDLIPEFQLLMFAELCHNVMIYLKNVLAKEK